MAYIKDYQTGRNLLTIDGEYIKEYQLDMECECGQFVLGFDKSRRDDVANFIEYFNSIVVNNVSDFDDRCTIDINAKEFCLIALDLINKKLKNKYFRAKQQITVNSKLVLRGSVRSINETTNI